MQSRRRARTTLTGTLALVPLWASAGGAPPSSRDAHAAAGAETAAALEEVVVTGSYVARDSRSSSPSPLTVVGRADLEAAGAFEIADIVERLTINTGAENHADAFTQNLTTGTSNLNLRGLGLGSTLVLVNGRRQAASAVASDNGENFVDLASLPPAIALERIEILEDGASAVYGSDAVAGAANFITRSAYEGLELEVGLELDRYGRAENRFQVLFGATRGARHWLAAASYLVREPLLTRERRLSQPADDTSQAGNPGSFLLSEPPTDPTMRAVWAGAFDENRNGVADFVEPALGLPGVTDAAAPMFADRNCTTLATSDPAVVPALTKTVPTPKGDVLLGRCEFDFGRFWSLVPRERRTAAYVEFSAPLSDTLSARIEAHVADNDAQRSNSPSFPLATLPTVPATHPDNPYGVDVRFLGRLIGAGGRPAESRHASTTQRFAASLRRETGKGWSWMVGTQVSRNNFRVRVPDVLAGRFERALHGLGGAACDPVTGAPGIGSCRYYNPFGSALTGTGTANPPSLLDDLVADMRLVARSELATFGGLARRPLAELGGGPIELAAGAEYRAERLAYDYDANANGDAFSFLVGNPDFDDGRRVRALFGEVALPLTAGLEARLALRSENYGAGMASTDPKAALLWRPARRLAVRASAGSSFRAPSLFQSFGTQTTLTELVDPTVGTRQFLPVRNGHAGLAPPLEPEAATTLSAGLDWQATERLRAAVAYWGFDYRDIIVEQNPQAILNAAAAGDAGALTQIRRDPESGLLLGVAAHYVNASSLETQGADLRLEYERMGNAGRFHAAVDATFVARYRIDDPQVGRVEGAGRRNYANFATSAPKWRAIARFDWHGGRQGALLVLRYVGAYADDGAAVAGDAAPLPRIGQDVRVDVQYGYSLGQEGGTELVLGLINAFDRSPPHVATNGGYDSKVHDPRGRRLYLEARWRR